MRNITKVQIEDTHTKIVQRLHKSPALALNAVRAAMDSGLAIPSEEARTFVAAYIKQAVQVKWDELRAEVGLSACAAPRVSNLIKR
jgi:hypothetical protein